MRTPKRHHSATRPVIVCLIGVGFIAAFKILMHYQVGQIGSPGDIGGGVIPLIGLIVLAVGIVEGLAVLAASVKRRRAGNSPPSGLADLADHPLAPLRRDTPRGAPQRGQD